MHASNTADWTATNASLRRDFALFDMILEMHLDASRVAGECCRLLGLRFLPTAGRGAYGSEGSTATPIRRWRETLQLSCNHDPGVAAAQGVQVLCCLLFRERNAAP